MGWSQADFLINRASEGFELPLYWWYYFDSFCPSDPAAALTPKGWIWSSSIICNLCKEKGGEGHYWEISKFLMGWRHSQRTEYSRHCLSVVVLWNNGMTNAPCYQIWESGSIEQDADVVYYLQGMLPQPSGTWREQKSFGRTWKVKTKRMWSSPNSAMVPLEPLRPFSRDLY